MALFESKIIEKIFWITFPEELEVSELKQIPILQQKWVESESNLIIYDFKSVKKVSHKAYRYFIEVQNLMKKSGKIYATLNVNSEIKNQLASDGMLGVLRVVTDLEAAKKLAGIQTQKSVLDALFIQAFISGVIGAFGVQANVKVTVGKPVVKEAGMDLPGVEIASVISLVSDSVQGVVGLCFPKKTFIHVYSKMFEEPRDELTPDMEDLAGELLNIIFGQAKAELKNQKGLAVQMAIPTVFVGEKLRLRQTSQVKAIVIPFETEKGPFHLEITLEQKS